MTELEFESSVPSKTIDRINDLIQKEIALSKSDITRRKYMQVIADALVAVKVINDTDRQGNVIQKEIPDITRRQWAVEKCIILFGDEKNKDTTTINLNKIEIIVEYENPSTTKRTDNPDDCIDVEASAMLSQQGA